MIQEHWLSEHQLQQLHTLDVQFVAQLGMENSLSSGIYRGRPFGGVAICWSPDLDYAVKPISNFKHKCVVAVELKTAAFDVLLISVYMPFFNSRNRDQCLDETTDAISMIELLIDDHPEHKIIIGGDLKDSSLFDHFWRDLMTKN